MVVGCVCETVGLLVLDGRRHVAAGTRRQVDRHRSRLERRDHLRVDELGRRLARDERRGDHNVNLERRRDAKDKESRLRQMDKMGV